MTDKTKRIGLVALGAIVCVVLAVAIAGRFSSPQATEPVLNNSESSETEPQTDIETPELNIQTSDGSDTEAADPGTGADSVGTEQTLQADPVKPEAPEPLTSADDDHNSEDVPEEERNTETPPTYDPGQTTVTSTTTEPEAGSTNEQGQMYVPGFGYISGGGESTGTVNEGMYENGNKVGTMD